MNKRRVGQEYEQAAARTLMDNGYEVLEFNYRCRLGEVDIIAKDGEEIVFIEVKYRSTLKYGSPFEAVDYKKQCTIKKMAQYYLYEHKLPLDTYVRFDVVGITGYNVEIIKNAFGGF